ncbi:MAG: CoA pyrophosphatase [Bacteroidales bacterium]|nr:CoA pyrophosphatase [Bacteroidales bacterium]MBN2699154.1 CoA pyrophosphatase [Bacteroidales bacterium]
MIKSFSGPLPGHAAWEKMAPEFRGNFQHYVDRRIAAVLVIIFPYPKVHHLLFIKRNEYPGPHSSQISFPGGLHETYDIDLSHTAIREAREETGLNEEIEILGTLTPLYIPISNFLVTPYVGWVSTPPAFKPDASEVKYLITVPISELLNGENIKREKMKGHDVEFMAPYYAFGKEKIWGATAMILSEFIEVAGWRQ